MSEKKVGKRLLTWVLVLVMTLSLLPLNVLAASPAVMRIVRPDTDKYITYEFYLTNEEEAEPYNSQIIKTGDTLLEPEVTVQNGKRLLTWVLVLVMTLSLLPLNVLAANPAVMRIVRPDTDKYITYNFYKR